MIVGMPQRVQLLVQAGVIVGLSKDAHVLGGVGAAAPVIQLLLQAGIVGVTVAHASWGR